MKEPAPRTISTEKRLQSMADFSCSISQRRSGVVSLAEGAGGQEMQDLIKTTITSLYGHGFTPNHDGAVFDVTGKLAFTTDSYVVKPLFFPGGDIGKLAVYGTINDLGMCGAKPLYLSCSFIIEEGFPFETLDRICASMAEASRETRVSIVTGDTKVVGRGQADGIYINTSGVGVVPPGVVIHPTQVLPGDLLILSGDLGRHGIAVMSAREKLPMTHLPKSDCAPLAEAVEALLQAGVRPKCLRDLTRGGLAAALHEIADAAAVGMEIHESQILVQSQVRGVCEILGLNPLYIANEGRFLAVVSVDDTEGALATLKSIAVTANSCVIGKVTANNCVEMIGPYGARRILPALHGELLPRIC